MNLTNKILMPLIVLLKLNAVLTFTDEETAFGVTCKNFMQSVLKTRTFDKPMVTAFMLGKQTSSYPFELIDNPDTNSIPPMCQTIDAICVPAAKPELLVLGGFMYKIFSMLSPQDAAGYVEKSFELYELATSNKNMDTIDKRFKDAKNLCWVLKSGRPLTEEEKANYIHIRERISGFMRLNESINDCLMETDKSSRRSIALYGSSLTGLLENPLNWERYDPEEAILVSAVLSAVGLSPFVSFINTLTNNYDPGLDVSLPGVCMSLMHACKELHERDTAGRT